MLMMLYTKHVLCTILQREIFIETHAYDAFHNVRLLVHQIDVVG
jgi:hypothetical protein